MDIDGKPQKSQDMTVRVAQPQPSNQVVAFGGLPAQKQSLAQRELYASGDRIGGYGTSNLGSRSLVRQFGTEISAPTSSRIDRMRRPQVSSRPNRTVNPKQKPLDHQQNRPSTGFKEPPSRNYNPYA